MAQRIVALGMVFVILMVALLGLYFLMLHPAHHHGCPLMVFETMCTSTVVEHASFWNTMLASTFSSVILLLGFVFFVVRAPLPLFAHEQVRYRLYTVFRLRPTLFQELFARGIHNRKDP